MQKLIALAIASTLMLVVAGRAAAQDKTPKPADVKGLLDNEKVKVAEVRFKPGAVSKMQERGPRVIYYFTATHLKIATSDGKAAERHFKAGEVAWRDKETTEATNIGKNEARFLVVFVK
jgi:beta-alanine degradation protein BauB